MDLFVRFLPCLCLVTIVLSFPAAESFQSPLSGCSSPLRLTPSRTKLSGRCCQHYVRTPKCKVRCRISTGFRCCSLSSVQSQQIPREQDIDPEAIAFEDWLRKMGAEGIGSKVTVRRSLLGGRGLFATTDIKAGECVLLLPPSLVITEDTV